MPIIDTHLRRRKRSCSTTLCCFHFCFDGSGESGGGESRKNLMMSFAAFQLSDSLELLASQENFTTFLNTQKAAASENDVVIREYFCSPLLKKPFENWRKAFFLHVRILWLDSVIAYILQQLRFSAVLQLFSSAAVVGFYSAPSFAFLCHFWSWKQWHDDDGLEVKKHEEFF